jgi:hypothetical protein
MDLRSNKTKKRKKGTSEVSDDPILKLIGIADVEPFGHKIDEELYGDKA